MFNRIAELRRERRWSQAHLADLLSVTRQTVIALEAGKHDPGLALAMRVAWTFKLPIETIFLANLDERIAFLGETWEHRETRATAFNEERVLMKMGAQAWEMIGFGPNRLQFRRPTNRDLRSPWEYQRLEGLVSTRNRNELERAGWVYSGSWMGVFHYFKRPKPPPPA